MHIQPPSSLHTINFKHEVFEISIPLVDCLATSGEAMSSKILDPMIGEFGHEFTFLINVTNKYDYPNGKNL